MPRSARIDALGVLHHVIIPVHLLLRSGEAGISKVIRRLLRGYNVNMKSRKYLKVGLIILAVLVVSSVAGVGWLAPSDKLSWQQESVVHGSFNTSDSDAVSIDSDGLDEDTQDDDNLSLVLQPEVLPEKLILEIERYVQTHPASCESASTRAVVKYFGGSLTEDQIIAEVGADLSPRYFDSEGNLHWGNPQDKFVGDIDGENLYIDGYGVYNQPIKRVLDNHGFSRSISKNGWDRDELFAWVRSGYPAIIWISNDWKTKTVVTMIGPDGTENPWIFGEHAVVIRGVDRIRVYIMDVGNGSYYTVSYAKFDIGFANLGNMAIVVIPDE